MTEYLLPAHVFCCTDGSDAVLLDLRQDEYFLITGAQAAAFLNYFSRAALRPDEKEQKPSPAAPATNADGALREMYEGGLLSIGDPGAKQPVFEQPPPPIASLLDEASSADTTITVRHAFVFILACVGAMARLRLFPLESNVRRVRERRQRHSTIRCTDVALARQLVRIYARLRPWFPKRYACLFESLSLLEYLASFGSFPTWMFGVHIQPWDAHCWVQDKLVLYNEGLYEVSDYLTIMAV